MKLYEAMEKKDIDEISTRLTGIKERVKHTMDSICELCKLKAFSDVEFKFYFEQAAISTVENWTPECSRKTVKSIMSYIHLSIKGELIRKLCKKNKVTPYYLDLLLSIISQNLDIWKESDAQKIKDFLKTVKKLKDADSVFCKIRNEFNFSQPENTIQHFGIVQLKKHVAETLRIKMARAEEVVKLYYSGLNLWDHEEGIKFVTDVLYLQYPENKVRKMKQLYSEDAVKSLFNYLDNCVLPDKSKVLKEKNNSKPKTIDDILIAEIKVRAEKLTRKTKLTTKESDIINRKFKITGYYAEMLKEIHAHDMDLWKTDIVDLASVILILKPDTKKPVKVIQKLMSYDMDIVGATNHIFDASEKTKPKTDVFVATVNTKVKKETVKRDFGKMSARELFAIKC